MSWSDDEHGSDHGAPGRRTTRRWWTRAMICLRVRATWWYCAACAYDPEGEELR